MLEMDSMLLSKGDFRFMKVIYKIGNIMAVIPFYNFERNVITHRGLKNVQVMLITSFIIVGCSYSMYQRYLYFARLFSRTSVILDVVCEFFFVGMTLIALNDKQELWLKLTSNLQGIDKFFATRDLRQHFSQNTYVQYFFYLLVNWGGLAYTLYVWYLQVGPVVWATYGIHEFCSVYDGFLHFLVFIISWAIGLRYRYLNEFFDIGVVVRNKKVWRRKNEIYVIKKLMVVSRILGETVDIFNQIFGRVLVFMVGKTVTQILISLNYMIAGIKKYDENFNHALFVSNCILGLHALISAIMVSASCDYVVSESRRTIFLCYKFQEHFQEDPLVKNELYHLAEHLKANVTKITAANFFEINKNTLFGTLGTITTYFIIILQFNGNLSNDK